MDAATSSNTTDKDKRRVYGAFQTIEMFRELQAEMPMQMVAIFLIVAMKPGISQRDILKLLDISQASVSRNVLNLTDVNRRGGPGLNLIYQRRDALDSRLSTLHLTREGEQVIERLLSLRGLAA